MFRHLMPGPLLFAAVFIAGLASNQVFAEVLTGSYTGYFYSDTFMGLTTYPGTPASGSVTVDTSYFSQTGGDGTSFVEYEFFNADPDTHGMTFARDTQSGHTTSEGFAQSIRLVRGGAFDTLYFGAYSPGGGYGSSITLVGAPGSLFTGLSLDDIVTGPLALDLSRSLDYQGNYLEDPSLFGSVYRFDSFDMNVGAVPEPTLLMLMLSGLGMVALSCRSRQRTA